MEQTNRVEEFYKKLRINLEEQHNFPENYLYKRYNSRCRSSAFDFSIR